MSFFTSHNLFRYVFRPFLDQVACGVMMDRVCACTGASLVSRTCIHVCLCTCVSLYMCVSGITYMCMGMSVAGMYIQRRTCCIISMASADDMVVSELVRQARTTSQ
jgi:hypothetical protein